MSSEQFASVEEKLTLYSRQLAWLHTAPGDSKKSRLEIERERGADVELPDIEGFELLIEYLSELGYCKSGMNGADPLSFVEVGAWSKVSGVVDSWVLVLLVQLSRAYSAQSNKSREANCAPPYTPEVPPLTRAELIEMREATDKKLRMLFNA